MTEPSLVETLGSLRFLEGITAEELQQVASVARLETHSPGALLFREGQSLARIFLVAEGSVSLEICVAGQGCKRIQTIGQGELLGWSPILGQPVMTATARALTAVRLISLDATQILALCAHDPAFGFTFMQRTAGALAARLNATRLQLLDVFGAAMPTVAGG
jgi:CRP-like cAMP-binding protein